MIDIAKEWLKRLKSGTYEQTTEKLRNGDGFCCYGVLCDIASDMGMGKWDGDNFIYDGNTYDEEAPDDLLSMVGLYPDSRRGNENYRKFSVANDDGKTFEQIEGGLERYYKTGKALVD